MCVIFSDTVSCTHFKASNEEVMIIISIFRLEVNRWEKTVHNKTQKIVLCSRATNESRSVDTLFGKIVEKCKGQKGGDGK